MMRLVRGLLYPLIGFNLAILVATQTYDVYRRDREGGDFIATIWQPARNVLHDVSPYPGLDATNFVSESVYPPAIFLASLALALLPAAAATVLWQLLLLATAVITLVVLGTRDWRCYAIWLLSCPVILDVLYGNATLIVVLCAAIVWRYRDSPWITATALTAGIAIKLLLAPMWLWLLATRRYRAAFVTALAAPLLILLPWAGIGFDGLRAYPQTLVNLSRSLGENGVLVHAFARQMGLERDAAFAVSALVAVVLFAMALRFRGDDLSSFALFLAGALSLTPISWIYYPALLIVPIAVRWPRFSWPWAVFGALWVSWVHTPLGWATARLSAVVLSLCLVIVSGVVFTERLSRTPDDEGRLTAPRPAG